MREMKQYDENFAIRYFVEKIENGTDWIKTFRYLLDELKYRGNASVLGVSGSVMKTLCNLKIAQVVATEEYWFKVDEENMKRGSRNIYLIDLSKIRHIYNKVEEEIRKADLQKIGELQAELARLTESYIRKYPSKRF